MVSMVSLCTTLFKESTDRVFEDKWGVSGYVYSEGDTSEGSEGGISVLKDDRVTPRGRERSVKIIPQSFTIDTQNNYYDMIHGPWSDSRAVSSRVSQE